MANRAAQFRAENPGLYVSRKGRRFIEFNLGGGARRFIATLEPLHWGADQEIETAWGTGPAPWDYQVGGADYRSRAKRVFNYAPLVEWTHQGSGAWISLMPRELVYSNDLGNVQFIRAAQGVEASAADDVLHWDNAYGDGLDYEFQNHPNKLVKRLIVQTAASLPEPTAQILAGGNPVLNHQFELDWSGDLELWINGAAWNGRDPATTAGAIEFRLAATGEVIGQFPAALVYDADEAQAAGVVQRLSKAGNSLLIGVRTPLEWLQAAAYPVTVDPSPLTTQPGESTGKDTYIDTAAATTNYGTSLSLWTDSNAIRSLLEFDCSSVPAGSTCTSATLSLWSKDTNTAQAYGIHSLHSNVATWAEEEATWNIYKTGSNWPGSAGASTSGTDFEADASPTTIAYPTSADTEAQADLTAGASLTAARVAGWFGASNTNYGIVVGETGSTSARRWHSSGASTASYRPKLVIEYTSAGDLSVSVTEGLAAGESRSSSIPGAAVTAPTHVQTTTTTSTSAASSITKTGFAVGSAASRTLVAAVCWRDSAGSSPHVDSVVFNTTENFTYRVRSRLAYAGNQYITVEIWTLDNPTNATANVVATLSEAVTADNGIALIVSEYQGADSGVGNTEAEDGSSYHPNASLSTRSARSLVVGAACQQQSTNGVYTPDAGVTERADGGTAIGSSDSCMYWAGERYGTGGVDTIGATHSTSSVRWVMAAVELISSSVGLAASEGVTVGESAAVAPLIVPEYLYVNASESLGLGERLDLPDHSSKPFKPLSRVQYEIWLDDDRGRRVRMLDTVRNFSYTRVTNGIGRGTLTLQGDIDLNLLRADRMIEIWRAPEDGELQLETVLLVRNFTVYEGQAGRTVTVTGPDGNDLLTRRIVAYAAGTSQASKTGAADDVMKEIVEENLGGTAGTGRSLDGLDFDIEADASLGPTVTKGCAWKNVFDVLRELAEASEEKGTRLYFWVEPQAAGDGLGFRFRTSPEQPGVDRAAQGSQVMFGTEWGNLSDLELAYASWPEVTYAYAGGQGQGADRDVQEATDVGRAGASAWNRCEAFADATNESESAGVLDKAEQVLRAGAPRTTARGTLRDTGQFRYGVDWLFGDRVPVSLFGREYETVIEAVTVSVDQNGKEEISSEFELIL